MDNQITKIYKNLSTDMTPMNQPEGSLPFALNAVTSTDEGQRYTKSNEESNEPEVHIPLGYIIVGKENMSNNRVILFLKAENLNVSEIGIYDFNKKLYTTEVNDANSLADDKLGFTIEDQIQATYRLRRGCEDVVYWVQKNKKPRQFNFSNKLAYMNSNSRYVANLFNIQRTYKTIPNVAKVEVLESGGSLKPGSYNMSIQYIDADMNPSEFMFSTPLVHIYNDAATKEYREIRGSIQSDVDVEKFPVTGKAIKLTLSNLDKGYPFYRVAIAEANSGTGLVTKVMYSDVIPTELDSYIYTGENGAEIGSEEEVLQMMDIIESAEHIAQIENTLILANTKGSQDEICHLQKYASKIKADCITKEVVVNSLQDPANQKSATHEFYGGLSYMPGEIYSFGIVYIFDDMTVTPAFHIPGKLEKDKNVVFSPSVGTKPMATNNSSETSKYFNNNANTGKDYWGLDYAGQSLAGKPVRHHRFPTRAEASLELVKDSFEAAQSRLLYSLQLTVEGMLLTPIVCGEDDKDCTPTYKKPFSVRVEYKFAGTSHSFEATVNPASYSDNTGKFDFSIISNSIFHETAEFTEVVITYANEDGIYIPWSEGMGNKCEAVSYFEGEMCTKITTVENTTTYQGRVTTTTLMGLKLSGIEKPKKTEGGKDIIGYYIVRNERTEFEKTIKDSFVLFPTVSNDRYISHGLLAPQTTSIEKSVYGLLHLEHKFNNKKYTDYDKLLMQGHFSIKERKLGKINYDDVYDGSSFDAKAHNKSNDDGGAADGSPTSIGLDGWSLNVISRDNIVEYKKAPKAIEFSNQRDVIDHFYLDSLESKNIDKNKKVVYNIAADNKIGIIRLKENVLDQELGQIPYGIMYKKNADPYANYRNLPYYKENLNPIYFTDKDSVATIYNGDSYISPMRYQNHVFWDNRVADRQGKKSFWKKALGIFIAVIGAGLAIFTGGISTALIYTGVAIAGGGLLLTASGIKQANYLKAYQEEYEKGLRSTALDSFTDMFYNYKNTIPFGFNVTSKGEHGQHGPSDDTIQWITDCVTDLWFDTSINTNLRIGFVNDESPTYLNAPGLIETGNDSPIRTWRLGDRRYTDSNDQRYPVSDLEFHSSRKLLAFDNERDDSKVYIGVPLGEYYKINPDYHRKNKQKSFYHLPSEYDCYSDCQEVFPHRFRYSLQSFQEELTDNYRVFLPNNYRDLEGETGVITNMFKIRNDLFLHTEDALWQVPRNHQERVTDQIVTFIGTGSYFEIPPIKILDDSTGNSAGCTHKWSLTISPIGAFFVTENQNKVFHFDGKGLRDLSAIEMSSFFKKNTKVQADLNYVRQHGKLSPTRNNPSNPNGTGFITSFDSRKNRLLVTKLDFVMEDGKRLNKSWTLSFSLEENGWISFHSYIPYIYLNVPEELFSLIHNNNNIWKHNIKGSYQRFYGERKPFIVEYYANQAPGATKIVDSILFNTDALKYHAELDQYHEERGITFNKAVFFNSRQCSGELKLVVKDSMKDSHKYLMNQVKNLELDSIIVDRNERDWSLNQIRDIRIDYTKPVFNTNLKDLQKNYFIDKILNVDTLDKNKDWMQLESFRDKYLGVRLIFDNFDDIKLLFNYTVENENISAR